MKHYQYNYSLLALFLAGFADRTVSFERRPVHKSHILLPSWGARPKRQGTQPIITPLIGRLSSTTTSSEDPDPHHTNSNDVVESVRRNLILSSAAILSSALLGIPSPSQAALDESENRRISTFERTAPSVVFIDTFTEKQDAFSPNVMEVPLGTGSGFVWDKEGHIGTCLTHIG